VRKSKKVVPKPHGSRISDRSHRDIHTGTTKKLEYNIFLHAGYI
jgi:hypothetical protein